MAEGGLMQSGGSGGGYGEMASLITAGVDDLMQSNEFYAGIYKDVLSKEAREKQMLTRDMSRAQTRNIELSNRTIEDEMKRKKKIRDLMLGYK